MPAKVSVESFASEQQMFQEFAETAEPQLCQALVARYGVDVGHDATAAAMLFAWEHWAAICELRCPTAYLFRVGQSSTRRHWAWIKRRSILFPRETPAPSFASSVDLGDVLAMLPATQRVCVVLVHAHGWRYGEVAELLEISVDAVTNHVHRGSKRLRILLEDDNMADSDRRGSND
jgi:DNA-directed RNA polymerase specialized sigma24 family protein